MFDTRLSAIRPPSRRRKFGSSFIVEMILPRAGVVGAPTESDRGRARSGPRVDLFAEDDAGEERRFLAFDPACERADCVLTYADLQVAALAERWSMPTRAPTRPALADQKVRQTTASEQLPKKRLPRSHLQLTCQHWPRL